MTEQDDGQAEVPPEVPPEVTFTGSITLAPLGAANSEGAPGGT